MTRLITESEADFNNIFLYKWASRAHGNSPSLCNILEAYLGKGRTAKRAHQNLVLCLWLSYLVAFDFLVYSSKENRLQKLI